LINEIAASFSVPSFLVGSGRVDFPKLFMEQVETAAELLREKDPTAYLVVAVDAADNSVEAALTRIIRED
jgi:hypothetical protein